MAIKVTNNALQIAADARGSRSLKTNRNYFLGKLRLSLNLPLRPLLNG